MSFGRRMGRLVAVAGLAAVATGHAQSDESATSEYRCPPLTVGAWRLECESDPLTDELIHSARLAAQNREAQASMRLSCDPGGYDVAIDGLPELEGVEVEVGYRFDRREPRFERWNVDDRSVRSGDSDTVRVIAEGLRNAERRLVVRVGALDPVFFDPAGAGTVLDAMAERCGFAPGGAADEDVSGQSAPGSLAAPSFPIVIHRDEARDEAASSVLEQMQAHWRRPEGIPDGLSAELRVRVAGDGTVLRAQVVRSSGHAAFDRNAERAVIEASPLQLGADPRPGAQFRTVRLTFSPDDA